MEIRRRNEKEIKSYEQAFGHDNLGAVPSGIPNTLNRLEQDSADMDGLYAFGDKKMQELFSEVLSTDGYLNDLCPICGAVKASTFDHYLPQTAYKLFLVHPLNLIPSCTICNGHKLKKIFDDRSGQRLYWNAYLDADTNERFLYCEISEEKGMPKASFRVEQGNLTDRYFEIVNNTFKDLHLDDTYNDASAREIVNLKKRCCTFYMKNQHLGLDDCIQTVADTLPDTDVNDWANVLHKSLIGTDIFKQFVKTALQQEYGVKV